MGHFRRQALPHRRDECLGVAAAAVVTNWTGGLKKIMAESDHFNSILIL
jgi:hypothetical protein